MTTRILGLLRENRRCVLHIGDRLTKVRNLIRDAILDFQKTKVKPEVQPEVLETVVTKLKHNTIWEVDIVLSECAKTFDLG